MSHTNYKKQECSTLALDILWERTTSPEGKGISPTLTSVSTLPLTTVSIKPKSKVAYKPTLQLVQVISEGGGSINTLLLQFNYEAHGNGTCINK